MERDRKKERESRGFRARSKVSFADGEGVQVASSRLKRPATLVPRASAGFSTSPYIFVYTRLQADLSGGWGIPSPSLGQEHSRFEADTFAIFSKTRLNPFLFPSMMKFQEIGGNWRKFRTKCEGCF